MRILALLLLAVGAPSVAGKDLRATPAQSDLVAVPNVSVNVTNVTVNVLDTAWRAIEIQLEHSEFPAIVALIALAFGLILLLRGKIFFDYSIIFFIAATVGMIAKQVALSSWDADKVLTSKEQAANVVGLLTAALAVWAANKGYDGILVILGTAVGFVVAAFVQGFLVINLNAKFMEKIEVQVVWYSLVCMACAYTIFVEKHVALLALICPIPGGIFTASGLLYFVTLAFAKFACTGAADDVGSGCSGGFTPKTGQWIQFFELGFEHLQGLNVSKDVGVFFNRTFSMEKDYEKSKVSGLGQDHMLTLVLWFFLAIFGYWFQKGQTTKKRARVTSVGGSFDVKKPAGKPAHGKHGKDDKKAGLLAAEVRPA